jgi:hypothetical protein
MDAFYGELANRLACATRAMRLRRPPRFYDPFLRHDAVIKQVVCGACGKSAAHRVVSRLHPDVVGPDAWTSVPTCPGPRPPFRPRLPTPPQFLLFPGSRSASSLRLARSWLDNGVVACWCLRLVKVSSFFIFLFFDVLPIFSIALCPRTTGGVQVVVSLPRPRATGG